MYIKKWLSLKYLIFDFSLTFLIIIARDSGKGVAVNVDCLAFESGDGMFQCEIWHFICSFTLHLKYIYKYIYVEAYT